MALRWQIVLTALIVGALGYGYFWFAGQEGAANASRDGPQRAGATLVLVEPLELAEDRVVVTAIGSGKALRSADIHPTVSGEVEEVLFRAGQRVTKGAPLIRLDDKHERLAVRLAEVAEADAKRQFERLKKLSDSGTVTEVRYETAQAAFESARVRLAQAQATLEDRAVFAPFDGVVGLSQVDPGDRVTDETVIATLDDRSAILIEFDVPEEYAGRVTPGDEAQVRPWTAPDRSLTGTIAAADNRIDRGTRSLRVQARIANPDDGIRSGTSFEVRLAFKGKSYPSLAEVAVLWSSDGAYVWRVSGGRAEQVFVKVVRRDKGRVLVDGPLRAGDLIVVEGVQGLRQGQAVEPAPFEREQASEAATPTPVGRG